MSEFQAACTSLYQITKGIYERKLSVALSWPSLWHASVDRTLHLFLPGWSIPWVRFPRLLGNKQILNSVPFDPIIS